MQTDTSTRPVSAIVFDIVGTLLDSTQGTTAEFHAVLDDIAEEDVISRIQHGATTRVEQWTESISRGDEPFALESTLRRNALQEALAEHRVKIDETALNRLANIGEQFPAFPDAAQQLDRLSQHAAVIGLTNSTLNQVAKASARSGLRWHAIAVAEYAQTFKPAPDAYALVPRMLNIDPRTAVFVAAHPWDLRGAAEAGFRTVYLPRPNTDAPEATDRFDLRVESLDELLPLLEDHDVNA